MSWTSVAGATDATWTDVAKPSESSVLILGGPTGQPIGLLLALTYAGEVSSVTTGWMDIAKPTSSVWTLVSKPTS